MPTVEYRSEAVECDASERLRDVLLAAGLPVHNGPKATSRHGLGSHLPSRPRIVWHLRGRRGS